MRPATATARSFPSGLSAAALASRDSPGRSQEGAPSCEAGRTRAALLRAPREQDAPVARGEHVRAHHLGLEAWAWREALPHGCEQPAHLEPAVEVRVRGAARRGPDLDLAGRHRELEPGHARPAHAPRVQGGRRLARAQGESRQNAASSPALTWAKERPASSDGDRNAATTSSPTTPSASASGAGPSSARRRDERRGREQEGECRRRAHGLP